MFCARQISLVVLLFSALSGVGCQLSARCETPRVIEIIETDPARLDLYKPIGLLHVERWSWFFYSPEKSAAQLKITIESDLREAAHQMGAEALTRFSTRVETRTSYYLPIPNAVFSVGWVEYHAQATALKKK